MNRNIERYRSPLFSPFLGIEPFNPFAGRKGLLDNMLDTGFSFSSLADIFDSDFGVKVVDKENRKEYQFGLPGIKKENISIDISGNILSITVNQKDETSTREYSSKVTLAPDLDVDNAEAESVNGLLTVSFPYIKRNTRKIEISSGDPNDGKLSVTSSEKEEAHQIKQEPDDDSETNQKEPQEHQI